MYRPLQRLARRWGPKSPAEEFYAQLDEDVLEDQLTAARDKADVNVSLTQLLTVATLRTPQFRVSKRKRALGHEFHEPLLSKWKQRHPKTYVAAHAPHGMVILEQTEPKFEVSLSPVGAPDFDWSSGRALLNRADAIAEQADTWIKHPPARLPHMERAYAVATQILAAVQRERWRRVDASLGTSDATTDAFERELASIRPQVKEAERLFAQSAEQNAQSAYLNGMAWGAGILALFCALGGWLLYHYDLSATIGVALPAGGLGAVVSVLQRLTTGSLKVDFRAPGRRVGINGGARPWIGAIFGMLLYALLQSGLFGLSVDPPQGVGPQLAFFGVLGFLAGFNERFAQDVVSKSASQLNAGP